MKKLHSTIFLSGALALSLLSASVSAAQSAIEITSDVNELIHVVDDQGNKQQKLVAAAEITPGDRILYTTSFKNNGAEASDNIIITNPIPVHTRYLDGSAKGEHCVITFSIDGGKAWGDAKTLKVRQKDGQFRAATAADYTHIRWKYNRALQPTEKKSISFETRLL
jgi:uncharacterized repeat protein (TIGR01451 family)